MAFQILGISQQCASEKLILGFFLSVLDTTTIVSLIILKTNFLNVMNFFFFVEGGGG